MTSAGREATFARRFVSGFFIFAATVLIVGFLAAALVRYSPGYGIDDCISNPRISSETCIAMAIQAKYEQHQSPLRFYARYLTRALHGDLGRSESFERPVTELLKDRIPISLRLWGWGTVGGLALGGALAWLAVWPRRTALQIPAVASSGLLLAIPPAVLALFLFFREWPLWIGIALALVPRVFGTTRALLEDCYVSPALLAARSRGLGGARLAVRYVLGPAASQFAALAGVALVIAFGSLIPIEALCDVPGIGQLTWLAASKRDLPLLSAMALIITTLVASVQWLGDLTR